jgi:hypothetical protein
MIVAVFAAPFDRLLGGEPVMASSALTVSKVDREVDAVVAHLARGNHRLRAERVAAVARRPAVELEQRDRVRARRGR